MPIYEYQCDKCGHEFEREQSISDPPVKTCPVCKGRKVTKLISRSSFVLKGGGWYADGYSDAKKSDAKDDGAKSDSGGSESKSESKESKDKKGSGKKDSKKAKASGKKKKDAA